MCGIAGIYAYRESAPPVDERELLRIREAMIHRGPDGAGLWISPDRKIGLAHRRLAIIDLSEAGAQPMATADGNFRITFNGEVYNYRQLRKELEANEYRFRSNSDTEVLLHLYAERGPEMVHALRGMYAFGIWDEYKKGVFLARDPFGIKPLYYADNGRTLRFASQVKALIHSGSIGKEAEPAGHAGFFIWGSVPEPFTLYKAVRAVPAGAKLWTDGRGLCGPTAFFSIAEEFAKAREQNIEDSDDSRAERALAALRDSDWAGMAHSLEIRLPYLDVSFFRSLAPLLSGKRAPGKVDLARALRPPLSDEMINRAKTGFTVPVREWCIDMFGKKAEARGIRGCAKHVMQQASAAPNVCVPVTAR